MTIDIEIVSRKANFNHVDYNYESSTIIVQHIVLPPPPPQHTHTTHHLSIKTDYHLTTDPDLSITNQ